VGISVGVGSRAKGDQSSMLVRALHRDDAAHPTHCFCLKVQDYTGFVEEIPAQNNVIRAGSRENKGALLHNRFISVEFGQDNVLRRHNLVRQK
jgi:hypothetical protein